MPVRFTRDRQVFHDGVRVGHIEKGSVRWVFRPDKTVVPHMPSIGSRWISTLKASVRAHLRGTDMTERNQHGQTHVERMNALRKNGQLATDCNAHHTTFGGRCLNCGWTPVEHKATLISPALDRHRDRY